MTTSARPYALCVALALSPGLSAQTPSDRPPTPPPAPATAPQKAPQVVKVYTASHASPADLVRALSRLYDNSSLRSVASLSGSSVVVSGRATDVEQALQALEALDFRPAVVAVEVLIVGGGEAPLDPKLFVGTGAEVAAALEGAKKNGVMVRQIVLDGIEGQAATKQTGEERSVVMATSSGGGDARGGRPTTQSINRRTLGTLVEATPRVRPDGRIALDLKIEDSRIVPPEASDGMPMFTTESFKGSLAVTPNQAQVVSSSDEARGKGQRTAFVVIARVVDGSAK